MFRSKRARDQHLQTHSNEDNPVRLSVRQRLGLQPPQVHIHQQTQMHSSEVQPPARRPTGVEPTFVHRTTSQQTQMHSSQVQSPARRTTGVEPTFAHRTASQPTQLHSSQVQLPARRPTRVEPTFAHRTASQHLLIEPTPTRTAEMSAKEVYDKLKIGERILVVVNEKNQPVGAAGKLCTTVMRYLIEEPNLCPPDAANWPEVKQISGVRLLRELRLMEAWEAEVSDRGGQRLEREVVFTEEELLQALEHIEIPPGFTDHQWGKVKSYFMSTKSKALS
ncbi:hypothetical protein ACFE04_023490 [Oxalis oulophora]